MRPGPALRVTIHFPDDVRTVVETWQNAYVCEDAATRFGEMMERLTPGATAHHDFACDRHGWEPMSSAKCPKCGFAACVERLQEECGDCLELFEEEKRECACVTPDCAHTAGVRASGPI